MRYFLQTTWFYEGHEMRKCADRSKTGHLDLIARVAAMIVATRQTEAGAEGEAISQRE